MVIELNKTDLVALVRGSTPSYAQFENQLVRKAGHSYSDQSSRTSWNNLEQLIDEELWELYVLCRDGWR